MQEIQLTSKIPSMQNITANAIWDDKNKYWIVTVSQISLSRDARTNEPLYCQEEETFYIKSCNEMVIPNAIMLMNGINPTIALQ